MEEDAGALLDWDRDIQLGKVQIASAINVIQERVHCYNAARGIVRFMSISIYSLTQKRCL
jgi:hypothetical protein